MLRRLGIACAGVVLGAAIVGGFALHSRLQENPAAAFHALVVYTTEDPDEHVTNGPEPGYRPALTGLTGDDILAAASRPDATGTTWVVRVTFTPRGNRLFSELTKANVAACPGGSCSRRHLAIWLDLTAADIQRWDDPAYVARVSDRYDLRCLARTPAQSACSKLVADPLTIEEIDGGQADVAAGLSHEDANAFVDSIKASGG